MPAAFVEVHLRNPKTLKSSDIKHLFKQLAGSAPDSMNAEYTTRSRPERRARRISTAQVHRILHPRQRASSAFDLLPWHECPVSRYRAA